MKELIEIIARTLVDQTEAVSVKEVAGANSSILELKAAKQDTGKVTGKQGRTADAMPTIVQAVSAKKVKLPPGLRNWCRMQQLPNDSFCDH